MSKTIQVSFDDLYPLIREAISNGNSFSFVAFGNSMYPYIRGGKDKVTLSPVSSELQAGNVVFYKRAGGAFVLHRIIKKDGNRLVLCGDNQFSLEEGISTNQVIAILSKIEKKSKVYSVNCFNEKIWIAYLPIRRFFKKTVYRFKRTLKRFLAKTRSFRNR